MRRAASCAAMNAPVVLTASMRCRRSGAISTNLEAWLDDAGVVEEGIEPAELGIGGLEEAGDVLGLGDVGLDGDRLAAGLAHVGDDGLGSRLVGGVVDDDVAAALRREPCGGCADAAAATGDEEDLGARRAHAVPPLAVLAK